MENASSGRALDRLALLRCVVAALGERAKPPWWRTQFLTPAGLSATEMIFPRTALLTAVRSTSSAARDDHDSKVGVGGRFHLFRLPVALECRFFEHLNDESLREQIRTVLGGNAAVLIDWLGETAGSVESDGVAGPISFGSESELSSGRALPKLASAYASACATGARCYPYFEAAEAGR
ncbi:MAG: BrxE family protein [Thermoleophilia bacterium]